MTVVSHRLMKVNVPFTSGINDADLFTGRRGIRRSEEDMIDFALPSETRDRVEPNDHSHVTNVEMYILGDKLDIAALKRLATNKYEQINQTGWKSAKFVESARILYENTLESDRQLKDAFVKTAAKNFNNLKHQEPFAALLKEQPCVAWEILQAVTEETELCPDSRIGTLGGVLRRPICSQYKIYSRANLES